MSVPTAALGRVWKFLEKGISNQPLDQGIARLETKTNKFRKHRGPSSRWALERRHTPTASTQAGQRPAPAGGGHPPIQPSRAPRKPGQPSPRNRLKPGPRRLDANDLHRRTNCSTLHREVETVGDPGGQSRHIAARETQSGDQGNGVFISHPVPGHHPEEVLGNLRKLTLVQKGPGAEHQGEGTHPGTRDEGRPIKRERLEIVADTRDNRGSPERTGTRPAGEMSQQPTSRHCPEGPRAWSRYCPETWTPGESGSGRTGTGDQGTTPAGPGPRPPAGSTRRYRSRYGWGRAPETGGQRANPAGTGTNP